MKKITLAILLALIFQIAVFSQGCLPDGIIFSTQSEIDNFQNNYPGCTEIEGNVEISSWQPGNITNLNGLSDIKSIGGNLEFSYNYNLINLIGLDSLTSIGASLRIENNGLQNLSGLDNLTSIGGSLVISGNETLVNLIGMANLTSIGQLFTIAGNDSLINLIGLSNLTSIGGWLYLGHNYALHNLSGLDNLTSVGGKINIYNNDNLQNLYGLDNLTSIGGDLRIAGNDVLLSLSGLNNLDANSIANLSIVNNISLISCEVQSICDYLSNPNGAINIKWNASGCNNPPEIANACGITLPCLPFGYYQFTTQDDIDSFQVIYPACTELNGYVGITGDNISNLDGLSVVTKFGGTFEITGNPSLNNLSGLNNVTSIGGKFIIHGNNSLKNLSGLDNLNFIAGEFKIKSNDSLASLSGLNSLDSVGRWLEIKNNPIHNLSGLDNLISIGEFLDITDNPNLIDVSALNNLTSIGGRLSIVNNDTLQNLSGLNNLTSVGGSLVVSENDILTSLLGLKNLHSIGDGWLTIQDNPLLLSLDGLDSIDANSIYTLQILSNDSLVTCDVQTICDYLANPNGIATIQNNNDGCNSKEEVKEACDETGVQNINFKTFFSIYPNPAKNEIYISTINGIAINEIRIYNQMGQRVLLKKIKEPIIDVSRLKKGIYVIELIADDVKLREKLIIQ